MHTLGLTEIGVILTVSILFAVVFLLVPYYLAFAEWPSLKQGQQAKDIGSPVS